MGDWVLCLPRIRPAMWESADHGPHLALESGPQLPGLASTHGHQVHSVHGPGQHRRQLLKETPKNKLGRTVRFLASNSLSCMAQRSQRLWRLPVGPDLPLFTNPGLAPRLFE